MMDSNRDGFLDKEDLKDTYASLGKRCSCGILRMPSVVIVPVAAMLLARQLLAGCKQGCEPPFLFRGDKCKWFTCS